MEEPGVTSITFYNGDLQAARAAVRDKFRQIVNANPWLAGRLEQKQLVHPTGSVSDEEFDELYDEGVYGSPAGIRKSLQSEGRLQSTSQALPSFFEALTCKLVQVSNWAGFADGITIEGCQQKLHLPLYSVGVIPFDCAIIFRPIPNRLAVMYFAKTISRAQLVAGCELGEPVSEFVFG
jgi:hypothetical protein